MHSHQRLLVESDFNFFQLYLIWKVDDHCLVLYIRQSCCQVCHGSMYQVVVYVLF